MEHESQEALTDDEIASAAQLACLLEVTAPKPGNVHRGRDLAGLRFEELAVSAVAVGQAMRDAPRVPVGETIRRAIRDTHRLVNTNTNLGMVLLLAPLAKAYGPGDWRAQLRRVLAELAVEDAQRVYEAIRLATPGGMGQVERGDISELPELTLRAAMELARERDSIAREYVTDFALTFEFTWPTLHRHRLDGCTVADAIVQTFLSILSEMPDTLIARKAGRPVAEHVSRRAREVLAAGGVYSQAGRQAINDLDCFLTGEGHRLNPGTTADLVTAGLFVWIVKEGTQVFPIV